MPTPFSKSSSSSSSSPSDASNRLVSSRCPECGAPVDFRSVPRDQLQIKCTYCGTLIAIPGRTQSHTSTRASVFSSSHSVSSTSHPTIVVSSDGKLVKGGWGCSAVGWMVLILILVVGGFGVASTNFINSATSWVYGINKGESESSLPSLQGESLPILIDIQMPLPPYRLSSAPLALGGDENAPVQMVVAAYQNDGSMLIGFDPAQRKEIWRSPALSERYYEMGLAADAARVYVADGAKLMALDRATGEIGWQSSLANNLQTGCAEDAPCLQRVGDQVIALARDGTVQGFAGATGAPLWSRRLNSQPRQFLVSGDKVILVDNDESNRAVVLVINSVNGDLLFELRPECVFPNITMRPHSSDQYLLTPDGAALVIVSSGTYACAWRYNLTDGALTWSYTPSDTNSPLPFTWSMSSLALADPIIYFVKDENDALQIYALDSHSEGSTPQPLYSIEDYELTLLYPLGDLLMVSAQPSYASDEVELWAIDRNTGERRWQRKLETKHTFDEWVTHPTDQGLFLSVCEWETNACRFEVLDITTGTSNGQVEQATNGSYDGAAWIGNLGYLTIDGQIYAVNLTTAEVEYTWP